MGAYVLWATCYTCKGIFWCNPHRVPSININGEREPICRTCVERANPRRVANGLDPIQVLPGAYEPVDEDAA